MTIEKLEHYRDICSNIAAIKLELKYIYNPVSSPNGKEMLGGGSMPSNQTERNALLAISINEKLEQRTNEQIELVTEIEDWLLSVSDPEIESIIRWHYIVGKNWKETSMKVYGIPNYDRARKKIHRFFQNL